MLGRARGLGLVRSTASPPTSRPEGGAMPVFLPALAAWLRTHHGIVSRATLLELGLSASNIRTMVATGELIVVYEGVYRHATRASTFEARCAAICAADRHVSSDHPARPSSATLAI